MQVFYCMGCRRFKGAEDAIDCDMVQFVPVPKFARTDDDEDEVLPFFGNEVAARRVMTPVLLCPECTPVVRHG